MITRMFRWLFIANQCQHNDDLVNQFEMKSEIDILKEYGLIPKAYNSSTRRMISDYKCNKCGRINRMIVFTV